MNNLSKIIRTADDFGLEILEDYKAKNDGDEDYVTLVDNRGSDWEIIFAVYEDRCIVTEYNFNCALVQQAEETTVTLEEALEVASQWC